MENKNFRIKEVSINKFIPQVEYKESEWRAIDFDENLNILIARYGGDVWQKTYCSKETYDDALNVINNYIEQERFSYVKYHYIN
jgi:hypothetical protein